MRTWLELLSRADNNAACQGREPGRHVDYGAPCEVLHSPLADETIGGPHPMGDGAVNNEGERQDENEVRGEAEALDVSPCGLCHASEQYCWSDSLHLEYVV